MNQRTRRRERVEVSGEEKYAEHCIRKRGGGGRRLGGKRDSEARGWKGKRKEERDWGEEERRKREEKKKKDSRILETKSRVVGWSNNRAALNTVIPAMLG